MRIIPKCQICENYGFKGALHQNDLFYVHTHPEGLICARVEHTNTVSTRQKSRMQWILQNFAQVFEKYHPLRVLKEYRVDGHFCILATKDEKYNKSRKKSRPIVANIRQGEGKMRSLREPSRKRKSTVSPTTPASRGREEKQNIEVGPKK